VSARIEVVSIGTQSRNPFWGETVAVRAPHATTALIRDGSTSILVDPSLPPELLVHRLDERAGLKPAQIDIVFLTTFRPVHRRGLTAFEAADWLIAEEERNVVQHVLRAGQLSAGVADPSSNEIAEELALLERTKPAPDKLSKSVSLFPSPGASPGSCALLVSAARTVIVAGDAVICRDHYEAGRVFDRSTHAEQARRSFAEIVELAEVVVPGHDNVFWIG